MEVLLESMDLPVSNCEPLQKNSLYALYLERFKFPCIHSQVMKPVSSCYLCNKEILSKSSLFIGRYKARLPLYTAFHKQCYEEALTKKKEKTATDAKNKQHLRAVSKQLNVPYSKFFYDLGMYQLNSYAHWIFAFALLFIGFVVLYLVFGTHSLFYFLSTILALELGIELFQLFYYTYKI